MAAARLTHGALYTGRSCSSSGIPRTTCVFKFRAASDGLSLRFVGATVIDAWGCRAGGGEALLGGEVKGATPIPRVKLQAHGKLYGSGNMFSGGPKPHPAATSRPSRTPRQLWQVRRGHVPQHLHLQQRKPAVRHAASDAREALNGGGSLADRQQSLVRPALRTRRLSSLSERKAQMRHGVGSLVNCLVELDQEPFQLVSENPAHACSRCNSRDRGTGSGANGRRHLGGGDARRLFDHHRPERVRHGVDRIAHCFVFPRFSRTAVSAGGQIRTF